MSFELIAIGDSKTVGLTCCAATNGYRNYLIESLDGENDALQASFVGVMATLGWTTEDALSALPAFIAAQAVAPSHILVGLGTNDLPPIRTGAVTEASWVADMGAILDSLHAEWPSAPIYLMRVYRSDYSAEQDTLDDVYIPAALTGRGAWAFVGPDERTFLPGNVTDITHPNATGYSLTAAEWQTAMGY